MSSGGRRRRVCFALLARRVRELAAGLAAPASARRPGRAAGAARRRPRRRALRVLADRRGRRGRRRRARAAGLGRALRGAGPDHVIGIPRGLALARGHAACRAGGSPPGRVTAATRRLLGATHGLAELARARPRPRPARRAGRGRRVRGAVHLRVRPGRRRACVYRHRQVRAQLDALRATYGITADDRLVAAFAPFALYGPALGIASAVTRRRRHRAGRADRRRAGRRRGRGRRHGGVRLARRAAQRRRHVDAGD